MAIKSTVILLAFVLVVTRIGSSQGFIDVIENDFQTEALVSALAKAPAYAPNPAPAYAPNLAPAHAPVQAPSKSPVPPLSKSPAQSQIKASTKSSVPSPSKAPARSPVPFPSMAPARPPIEHKHGCVAMCMTYCKPFTPRRLCMRICHPCCIKNKCVPRLMKCKSWDKIMFRGEMVSCP